MSQIKIKTLTPVHIGNGTELQGNFEYLYFQKEKKVAVIDAKKVLEILGEENLSQWISCIDNNQPLLPVIKTRKTDLQAIDVADRIIPSEYEPLVNKTAKSIREHIQGGNNTVLIPGSSLKGALRTAVFADRIIENQKIVQDDINLKNFRGGFSDEFVSKNVFGSDPNHDIFRLLQVGDAAFMQTEIFETNVLNLSGDNWRIKESLTQFVETIPAGEITTMRLNFQDILLKRSGYDYFNKNAPMLQLSNLLPQVNAHTQRLVEDEFNFWKEKISEHDVIANYTDQLERIVNISKNCERNECILRIGWGSGFRSMTGDWQGSMNDEDYLRLVKTLRKNHPEDLLFPKTTRLIAGGVPLGFVKLSL